MDITPQTDYLEYFLRSHKDRHNSYLKLQNLATEKDSVILLTKFNKIIPENTDTKQILSAPNLIFDKN